MSRDERQIDAGTRWPLASDRHVVVCAQTASKTERSLLDAWIGAHRPRSDAATVRTVYVPHPRGENVQPIADVIAQLLDDDERVLLPLRIVWKPKDPSRLPHLAETVVIGDPRHPRAQAQLAVHRLQPDRAIVVVAEPATIAQLREAWAQRSAAPADTFPRFVARRLTLALERAESKMLGPQHKVPKLVREEIATSARFRAGLARLAEQLGRDPEQVAAEADSHLDKIVAGYSRAQTDFTVFLSRQMYAQGYDREIDFDPAQVERIRDAMRQHPSVTLSTHRSYLDGMVLPVLSDTFGLPRRHVLVGSNMDFWPVGPIMRRAGGIFVLRDSKDAPVYRFALREYIGYLVEKRFHLEWFIEGGRSRTGKLLPPRLGALAYVVDAYRQGRTEDVVLIPVSIAYDHLREAADFAGEAGGKAKQAEDAGWMLRYWRGMRDRYGKIYVRFAEPLSLRETLGPPATVRDAEADALGLQKLAFEVSWRINQVTPATGTALVTLILLAAVDRALTLRQIRAAMTVLLDFARRHELPMTDSARRLDSDQGIQAALDALIHHGVVTRFDAGAEPVYGIGPGQHLVAAFYRNSIIHSFLNNAIIEVALVESAKSDVTDPLARFWDTAMALRDLLKFDFFFPEKDQFKRDLSAELRRHDPDWQQRLAKGPVRAEDVLGTFQFPVAHATLRPFIEAYLVVARELELNPSTGENLDQRAFLRSCTGLGRQMLLQKFIERPESVSQQLFKPALRLAENRGLLAVNADVAAQRSAFTAQLREVLRDIDVIEQIAADNFVALLAAAAD